MVEALEVAEAPEVAEALEVEAPVVAAEATKRLLAMNTTKRLQKH